ncbi:MAG: hypothetical protein ACKVP0_04890 [Pirellulaceae bacterium]
MQRLIVIVVVLVLVSIVIAGGWIIRDHLGGVRDAYALDWASASVISFIDHHEGRVPKDWNDLKAEFDTLSKSDKSWTFDEIQNRVVIDFESLSEWTKGTEQDSIIVRNVSGVRWSGPDPNDRIRECLSKYNGK